MSGNTFGQRRIGRLFAVLWILTAAFAMQIVTSAQAMSLRSSAPLNAGDAPSSGTGTNDSVLSRQAIRAVPMSDLRFTTERPDGKAAPAGPDPLTWTFGPLPRSTASACGTVFAIASPAIVSLPQSHHIRVRAPPAFLA